VTTTNFLFLVAYLYETVKLNNINAGSLQPWVQCLLYHTVQAQRKLVLPLTNGKFSSHALQM